MDDYLGFEFVRLHTHTHTSGQRAASGTRRTLTGRRAVASHRRLRKNVLDSVEDSLLRVTRMSNGFMPFSLRKLLIFSAPPMVSDDTTMAWRDGSVIVGPNGSTSSTTLSACGGFNFDMNA